MIRWALNRINKWTSTMGILFSINFIAHMIIRPSYWLRFLDWLSKLMRYWDRIWMSLPRLLDDFSLWYIDLVDCISSINSWLWGLWVDGDLVNLGGHVDGPICDGFFLANHLVLRWERVGDWGRFGGSCISLMRVSGINLHFEYNNKVCLFYDKYLILRYNKI